MIAIIRAGASFCIAVVAVAAVLPAAPSYAQTVAYVSAAGTGSSCTATTPCTFISSAIVIAGLNGKVVCLDGNVYEGGYSVGAINLHLDIDCPLATLGQLSFFNSMGTNPLTVRIRHLTFRSSTSGLSFSGGGTLIVEDCTFTDVTAPAIDVEPIGALNVVIRNSRISNSTGGILFKPAAGGSINATLDHVTIVDNTPGGGLKIDTTNGPVTVDITDSVISGNGAHGVNAVAGANQNMVSIKNSVIAKNGQDGVVANGANAAVLVQTTLLDQNVAGATLVASGGHISTYGNNSIVGTPGSGFTGPAPLQ